MLRPVEPSTRFFAVAAGAALLGVVVGATMFRRAAVRRALTSGTRKQECLASPGAEGVALSARGGGNLGEAAFLLDIDGTLVMTDGLYFEVFKVGHACLI